MISIPIPNLKLTSLNGREHWRPKAARVKAQRSLVALVLRGTVVKQMLTMSPLVVTITRSAPSEGLDDDNLVGSAKHVRDQIADELGLPNDRDKRVTWRVEQRRGPWGVHVQIEPMQREGASYAE
jgi:hypothetical protein